MRSLQAGARQGALDFGQQVPFGDRADHRAGSEIDRGLWHAADVITADELRKFHRLDRFGLHVRAFERHLVSQDDRLGTVWSGRRDEHLQVNGLGEVLQSQAGFRLER